MTITGRADAMKMLQDPEIVRVYEYESKMSGKTAWACFDEVGVKYDDVDSSPFVGSLVLLKDNGEITPTGHETLHRYLTRTRKETV